MDICQNNIDLMYFTKSSYLNRSSNNIIKCELSEDDLDFYKKRIFQLTKDLLRKKSTNKKVLGAFNDYALAAIKHFKFEDKKEIYQKEFDDLTEIKKEPIKDFEINDTTKIMTKEIKINQKSIKDLMNVKTNIKKKSMKIPKTKKININTNEFKMKGVKEKHR